MKEKKRDNIEDTDSYLNYFMGIGAKVSLENPEKVLAVVTDVTLIAGITATGISTFNCSSAHGLVKGNSLRLLDTDNNNLGDYIVESRVDVDSFSSVIGSTLAATSVLKHGLSANETVSDRTDENLAARGVSLYGDVSLTLSASATATSNT